MDFRECLVGDRTPPRHRCGEAHDIAAAILVRDATKAPIKLSEENSPHIVAVRK